MKHCREWEEDDVASQRKKFYAKTRLTEEDVCLLIEIFKGIF